MSYNGWSYANGNPANATDPSGQCTGIAPWTDFLGGALSNTGSGPAALPGYFQAALAAGQKAGENCAQNLAMASTRFQQGNYGSSLAYASGLLTSLNEAQGLLAEVNRGDYGTKARASFERGDYWSSLGYATRVPQAAEAGLGFWAQWFQDVETTSKQPKDLAELIAFGEASCRLGGTGLMIASLLVPAGSAVKAGLTSRWGAAKGVGALTEAQPASVEELIAMMNRRPNVHAKFAEGEQLAYMRKLGLEGTHVDLAGRSEIYLDRDVATRTTAVHEWMHKLLAERNVQMTPGEIEAWIENFTARHRGILRLGQ